MSDSTNNFVAGSARSASVPTERPAGRAGGSGRPAAKGRVAERPVAKGHVAERRGGGERTAARRAVGGRKAERSATERSAAPFRKMDGGAARSNGARGASRRAGRPFSARRGAASAPHGVDAARATGEEAKFRAANVVSSVAGWADSHRFASAAAAVVLVVAVTLYAPLQSYYSAVRTNEALSSQLTAISTSNDVMQSQVDALMTKEGIEDEARRRGYVEEGESAVDMSGVTDSMDPSSDPTVTSSSSSSSSSGSGDSSASEASTGDGSSDDGTSSVAASGTSSETWYTTVLDFVFGYNPEDQGVA